MARHDPAAARWYPQVVQLAYSPLIELRQTAAWIMGQDHTYAPFHEALLKLIADPQPMVRRNAALALSNFGDPAARPELLAMLRPYTIVSPAAGVVQYRLKLGEYVNPGTLVAHVGDVRGALSAARRSARVEPAVKAARCGAGDPLVEISADKEHVWEALRALWTVGTADDLEEVQRYARGVSGMPEKVQEQALLTAQAIQARGTR